MVITPSLNFTYTWTARVYINTHIFCNNYIIISDGKIENQVQMSQNGFPEESL